MWPQVAKWIYGTHNIWATSASKATSGRKSHVWAAVLESFTFIKQEQPHEKCLFVPCPSLDPPSLQALRAELHFTFKLTSRLRPLSNVRVEKLPPNTTAKIQPLDQGIINSIQRFILSQK
ncbi:uncharacterized protein PITG_10093 [Phytophthora infestans T30-4]|uniref:DDE-1 domain-containing protein n=1 Tax=Phytophthora infestans (strain T30-4) TaxID=403677 RepID=D0NEA5_PHYIT|nr:uncharacterized protein PITG_10093 [Phytophthora infestans T30-4]EEY56550.1 hypothetical protein PITG_10093 [Phytophthora infestans T30-4]|eukprot:XP_002902624.1 hypothetical protein PITG_10093 [Phytophthora infestans T30-4]